MSKKNDETLAPEVADRESFQTFSPDSTAADYRDSRFIH